MMMNSSQPAFFILTAYVDTGRLRYLFFLIVLILYVLIIVTNVFLVVLICINRSLHEPMYVFLCSLFINELYGSTALFPLLLLQILSDIHAVSAPLCFLQIFCLYSYASVEFFSLSVMSYDRYLAICCPLQYRTRMTQGFIFVLIAAAWVSACVVCAVPLVMSWPLRRCGNTIHTIYCTNYSIVRLSCSDTSVNNIYGLTASAVSVFSPLLLIFYTYSRILQVCSSGSAQTRQKALSTCSPHLASLLNFTFGVCFELLQSRFNMSRVPNQLRIFLSMYWLTCQPIFTPLTYGLALSSIRSVSRKLLST